jgi:hypothetical protein
MTSMTQTNLTASTGSSSEDKKQYAVFADFNSMAMEARIQHMEIKVGKTGEYAAITAITNLKNGERGVAVRFVGFGSILSLAKAGHLVPGRRVHLTGNVTEIATSYVTQDGEFRPLERARMNMRDVTLKLGPLPKSAQQAA